MINSYSFAGNITMEETFGIRKYRFEDIIKMDKLIKLSIVQNI